MFFKFYYASFAILGQQIIFISDSDHGLVSLKSY